MIRDKQKRLEQLFHAALEHAPDQRNAYLERVCGSDIHLRRELESLLTADSGADEFLETPPLDHRGRPSPSADLPRMLGSYQLVRVIGAGGMGTVYEAIQKEPRRVVALKLMNTGLTSAAALRRFQDEARILARLRHPGIAQVFEAGTHGDGSAGVPYFAMEYVPDASNVISFARSRKLGTRERLELLRQVCDAVNHAHQQGVIHRDLKPGNILVESTGQPKVIDFGVARVTDQEVQPTTLRTDLGQLVGTLAYMSPEQILGEGDSVDTRSDVYTLGVIAYELLADRLPYEVRGQTIPEAIRLIRDDEPTRLSAVSRVFRGDVETIVAKALEKDKARRYQSAADLSADIQRYLRDEPIVARRAGVGYQLRKFARRNKALAAGICVALLGLVFGAAAAVWQAVEATSQRNLAQLEARRSARVTDFLESILTAANPKQGRRDITVRAVLDEASQRLDAEFADDPEVESTVRFSIANSYMTIGDLEAAELHLRRFWQLERAAYGENSPRELCAVNLVANVMRQHGDFLGVRDLINEVLPRARRSPGGADPNVACMLQHLGYAQHALGETALGEQLLDEALDIVDALPGDHRKLRTEVLDTLGEVALCGANPERVVGIHRELLALRRDRFGEIHECTAWAKIYLAQTLLNDCDISHAAMEEAEALTLDAMTTLRNLFGDESHDMSVALSYYGTLLSKQGLLDEAEAAYRRSLELKRSLMGDEHVDVTNSLSNLGILLYKRGRLEEAESVLREAHDIRTRIMVPSHSAVGDVVSNLARVLCAAGKPDDARSVITNHLANLATLLGTDHPHVQNAKALLNNPCPVDLAASP